MGNEGIMGVHDFMISSEILAEKASAIPGCRVKRSVSNFKEKPERIDQGLKGSVVSG
jgi:hypothetical protein